MKAKTAIIGNYDSVLAFKAGGVDAFGAKDSGEAKNLIKQIAKDYAVIFLTDDFALELDDYLKRFLESAYPIIVPVPSKNGSNGYTDKKLKEESERALGVDILFSRVNKEEK